jgi:predicted enzyme related to lactoylglutathione lyase
MVEGIAFFAYSVRDVPRARAFYAGVLGLKPGDVDSDHWVEFDVGPVTFGIGNGEPLGYEPGKSTGAAFEVDDVAAMRERVIAGGGQAGDVAETPVCFVSFAKDPEGNGFALHRRK